MDPNNDPDTSTKDDQEEEGEEDSSWPPSVSDAAERSSDEYKQAGSSMCDDDDDKVESQSDVQSNNVPSDGESERTDLSSELDWNTPDKTLNITEQEDVISGISDSVGDPEEMHDVKIHVSTNEEEDARNLEKNTDEDPDKMTEYHPTNLSRGTSGGGLN